MIFPRGGLNSENNKYEVLLMVSIRDPKGAITNSTQVLEVNPPHSLDINSQL